MRFLMMHRLDESAPEAWNPSKEFIEKMGAFIEDSFEKGVLITAEGVHPSERGAKVRKVRGGKITATDGPFTEAKEVIGGFALINAKDLAEAVAFAETYAALFEEIEVEVRTVVEAEDIEAFTS
ncbi:YciI family protein [Amycolatopsis japonica]|uniref:YciI family protein n=1 Tax=Amycolatopsis japonica TaxID=208439 RepID=UPI0033323BE2